MVAAPRMVCQSDWLPMQMAIFPEVFCEVVPITISLLIYLPMLLVRPVISVRHQCQLLGEDTNAHESARFSSFRQ
jgi:hypothetical protein